MTGSPGRTREVSGVSSSASPAPAPARPNSNSPNESYTEADRRLGLGRAVLRGSLIGFVMVASVALVIALLAGFGTTSALGVSAFAGMWGGPGFGGMLGATLAANRAES